MVLPLAVSALPSGGALSSLLGQRQEPQTAERAGIPPRGCGYAKRPTGRIVRHRRDIHPYKAKYTPNRHRTQAQTEEKPSRIIVKRKMQRNGGLQDALDPNAPRTTGVRVVARDSHQDKAQPQPQGQTMPHSWVYDDGGRAAAGFKGKAGDCVARSIAIASGRPYAEVYARLAAETGSQRAGKRGRRSASARNGINVGRKWFKAYMAELGAKWTPTMHIGSGCTVHLRAEELPAGRLVVSVSKHYTAVIDGLIRDTHNPSALPPTIYPPNYSGNIPAGAKRLDNGGGYIYAPWRCVYGYWTFPDRA